MFDPGKPVQPSLIFASKSRTNPSGASYGEAILGWDARDEYFSLFVSSMAGNEKSAC